MRFVGIVLCAIALFATPARADDKPWAAGVSADSQKAALALYTEANKAFNEFDYKPALETYGRALVIWDHPLIRYNMAVCLINLDRVVEAYDNLERAMRFGVAPLGPDLWMQAQSYQKLLAGRVAEIEVTAEPGASVSLDGKPLTQPHERVLTGDHQIVVEKPRYLTETRSVTAKPGDHISIKIELKPLATAKMLHRKWSRWVPWAVLGTGVVVAAVGAPVLLSSSHTYDEYSAYSDANCKTGCVVGDHSAASDHLADLDSSAKLKNNVAVSLFAVGGAVAATGFVMVILNQPRLVTPVVGSDHVGLAISGRF